MPSAFDRPTVLRTAASAAGMCLGWPSPAAEAAAVVGARDPTHPKRELRQDADEGGVPAGAARRRRALRVSSRAVVAIYDAEHLLGTARAEHGFVTTWTDTQVSSGRQYTYHVTALDRLHHERAPSNPQIVRT